MFAAQLRGATDDTGALSWMIQEGYALDGGDVIVLTDAGIERADGIIDGDPGLHR